jgi:Cu2+-exporting ATPase
MTAGAAAADWSVYDRPALRDAVSAPGRAGRDILLAVDGMHCASCVARVERALAGARDVRVNLAARAVEFAWDPARVPLSSLLRALDDAGFRPQLLADDAALRAAARARRHELARLGVSAILSMQVMMLAWPGYFTGGAVDPALDPLFRWSQWLLATPVVLYGGWPFFRNAWQSLRARLPGMDVPVALALGIAYLASAARTLAGSGEIWFDSATMFVLLLGAGRYLEGRTRALAAQRLRLLAGRQPLTARRVDGDAVTEVPAGELRAGDRVQVRSGEAAPVDGSLLGTPAELDESLLTGESRPVRREPGERVLAGSLNAGAGAVLLAAERVGGATHLSHIARLLNRAQAGRPRVQQLADRLAGGFIAAVLLLAALGAWLAAGRGADAALSVALAVLVASCPCALSLAVPAAVAAASSGLAGAGALLASPDALARLRDADTFVFDKTGTLTRPGLAIAEVRPLADLDAQRCLALAAALERDSTHPIAQAFAAVPTPLRAAGVRHEPGRGVSGAVDGARYALGATDAAPDGGGALTWVQLADESRPLALIGLAAPVRAEAAAALDALRARGCALELLTGDAPEAAAPLARGLGLAGVRSRQSAEDKLARLRELQARGRVVVAVGDGINDAPFLAGADVAVAMPRGAALAQARADVILLGDSLAPLPLLLDTARRAMRVSRQNLAWALGYNLAVLPLAMAGWLAPWMAALGMSLSSLLVVGNAVRLARAPRG